MKTMVLVISLSMVAMIMAQESPTNRISQLLYSVDDRLELATLVYLPGQELIEVKNTDTLFTLDPEASAFAVWASFHYDSGGNESTEKTDTWLATTSTSFNESSLIKIDSKGQSHVEADSLPPSEYVWVDEAGSEAWLVSNRVKSVFKVDLHSGQVTKIAQYKEKERPRALAIDQCTGYVFWLVWSSSGTRIEFKSSASSSGSSTILTELEFKVYALAVDSSSVASNQLMWIGRSTKGGLLVGSVEVLDGVVKVEVICHNDHIDHVPFDMSVNKELIVWSDWKHRGIWTIDRKHGKDQDICKPHLLTTLGSQRPLGVNLVHGSEKICNLHESKHLESMLNTLKTETTTVTTTTEITENGNFVPPEENEADCAPSFCLNNGVCHVLKKNRMECSCPRGFEGERCERDLCFQRCLNNGICKVVHNDDDEEDEVECQCGNQHTGVRCEISLIDNDDVDFENRLISGLLFGTVILGMIFVLACLLALLCCRRSTTRPKVRTLDRQIYVQQAVGDDDKMFKDEFGKCKGNSGILESSVVNGSSKCVMDTRNGVVVDLEDCCQMTLCNEPCLDAVLYRKGAGSRRPRRRSTSSKSMSSTDDDRKKLIQM